ncbi:bile acyl-CoA synthetase isoform X2 [Gallus gallus]|uniref:long-chain-fatty-acid--CoA ligase n=1 Tax=Gallus gallus TaxID=9031 RepID=A0A1D5P3W4_CHICK|nr:bile acyl-CoA synthetase isoform X2 [Gallus gallus]
MLGVLVAAVAGLLLLLLLHGRWFPFLWADLGAFVALDEVYTFSDMERRSNRAARAFALRLGLQPGQTVAVFLPNVPAYVWTWLALAKLGCAMACLNCNVRGRALLHARSAARADIVLSCSELQAAVEEVLPDLKQEGVRVFYLNSTSPTPGVEALLPAIEAASDEPMPQYHTNTTTASKAIYIYTSGTTGLPKAAVVTEMKVMMVANLARICGLRENDIVYTTLPLYHSAGLLIGVGGCLEVGATCVLRAKFSASQFWDDCRRYNVTVIQYVGELMRYLCNSPRRANDREHGVRLAIGNGLRATVWKEFLQRFGPISISEFYGATEGNAGFINYTGKIGAVGRVNVFLKAFASFELIKYNVEEDEPVRNEHGFCIRVRPGETGLLVIKITKSTPFHGYAGDSQKTEKKILRDVFVKGDAFFNSGDLLMMDQEKFLYFQDRVGDTFRWKGENVATTEVEATLAMVDFIQEVNVYGVPVPGCEGKCGMAAVRLKPGQSFDGESLYTFTRDTLPIYAAPRFVRIQNVLEITGTFKQCKGNLVKEGFDPNIITDPLFFRDEKKKSYVPMNPNIYANILDGSLNL